MWRIIGAWATLLALALAGLVVACGGNQRVEHDYQLNVNVQITGAVAVSGGYTTSPLIPSSQVQRTDHACADSVKEPAYLMPAPDVRGHTARMGVLLVRSSAVAGTYPISGALTIDDKDYTLTGTGMATLQPDGGGSLRFTNAPARAPATGVISGSISWTCKDVTRTIG